MTPQDSSIRGFYGWTDTLKGIYYGPGCLDEALPKLLETLGVHRALVVTGRSLNEKTDVVRKVENILKKHNAFGATIADIGEHAPISGIDHGVEMDQDHYCDFIMSVGGGSPIDASKVISYHIQRASRGKAPRHIAIPTTLSASEYTSLGGYTNESGRKVAVSSSEIAPAGVILDAELTLATPERLWLSTGIRALDHAIETLYRPSVPTPVKHLAYSAIAELFAYLPESKANPQDVVVRQKLQIAAWMSLWPLKMENPSGLGLSHVLGHALGATYGIPHGITSCITLAPVVSLEAEVASEEEKESLRRALFYLRIPSGNCVEDDVRKLSSAIKKLVADLGLESSLTEYHVPRADIPSIVETALGSKDDPRFSKVVALLAGLH